MMIENLLMKGCRIDAIGAQYHMFQRAEKYFSDTRKFYNLPHLFEALDNNGRFKKPIEITEVTIPAFTAEYIRAVWEYLVYSGDSFFVSGLLPMLKIIVEGMYNRITDFGLFY